jgi:Bacterial regulatory proteins, luxR family
VLASLAFERARASESSSEAAEHLERALAGGGLLGEQEVDVTGPLCLLLVGLLATDARDVARAKTDAQTALELLTAHDIHLGRAFALGLLIEALIEDREVEAAEVALRTSGLGDEIPPGMAINDLLEARGLLRIAQGRTRQGLDDLLEFGRRDELWGGANPLASRWRVAELAADGQSNPEIAQALFVTRKTVETHLGHVYRKLDISGRAELRRALG